jgi:hypothetical protein
MANKTQGTRQKMVFRGSRETPSRNTTTIAIPAAKPRNPLATLAKARKAGAHRKDSAAQRAAARRQLRKLIDSSGS